MCAGTVTDKYDNIKKWAETNNMKIHPSKTKELVVTRARTRSMHPPSKPFIEEAESYHTQSPWSPSQREIYHDRPRFTGFEHLLFFNVRVETSPDPRSPTARTPPGDKTHHRFIHSVCNPGVVGSRGRRGPSSTPGTAHSQNTTKRLLAFRLPKHCIFG